MELTQLGVGFLLAALVSFLAWKAQALSFSGAVAAGVLGTIIFGLGGLAWAILLLTFFISSSLLSKAFPSRKANIAEKFSKGARRDAGQVLANGGVAGVIVLLHAIFPGAYWIWAAFAASLAAVNADTWGTELGVLSPTTPRLITTLKPVVRGTSGGISLVGTIASLGGAMFIALPAALMWGGEFDISPDTDRVLHFGLVALSGFLGSLIDSVLGATVQCIYHCAVCDKETERHPEHICGSRTTRLRGWRWLNNDWVNTFCALTAASATGLAVQVTTAAALLLDRFA